MALQLLIRFVAGGALVAILPLISQRLGPETAGLALLFPAVSFAGLLFVGQSEGLPAVATASITAVFALPTVAAFLVAVHIGAQRGMPLAQVLGAGLVAWIAVAVPFDVWNRRRSV